MKTIMKLLTSIALSYARLRSERGASIVLIALSLPVLFAMVAFAIDYNAAASSISQARGYTRLIALKAIAAYVDRTEGETQQQRLARVKSHVNKIYRQNFVLSHPGIEPKVIMWKGENTPDAGGAMIAGSYYDKRVPETVCGPGVPCHDCNNGTCDPCQNGSVPCMNEVSWAALSTENPPPVTSIKVESEAYESVVMTFARGLLGEVRLPIKAAAIASLVPRYLGIIIDNSNSVTGDNYIKRPVKLYNDPEDPKGLEGAYRDDTLWKGRGSNFGYFLTCDPLNYRCPPTVSCPACVPSSYVFSQDATWKFLAEFRETAPLPYYFPGAGIRRQEAEINFKYYDPKTGRVFVNNHFVDDYERLVRPRVPEELAQYGFSIEEIEEIRKKHAYPPGGCEYMQDEDHCIPTSYAVMADTGYDRDPLRFPRPEPLSSIRDGVRMFIEKMQERSVVGDTVQLTIGAAQIPVPWHGVTKPLPASDPYLRKLTADTDEGRLLRRALFHFPDGKDLFTNLYGLIVSETAKWAADWVKVNGLSEVRIDWILFSDALANCMPLDPSFAAYDMVPNGIIGSEDLGMVTACLPLADGTCPSICHCPSTGACCTQADIAMVVSHYGAAVGCSDQYITYIEAMKNLKQFFHQNLQSNIALNFMAFGSNVGVHRLDHFDPELGRCLNDDEIRAKALPVFLGGTADGTPCDLNPQVGNPDACADEFYSMSSEKPFFDPPAQMAQIAQATGGAVGVFLPPAEHCATEAGLCQGKKVPPDPRCCTQDENYRRLSDKLCEGYEKQVEKFVDQVMKKHNFVRVVYSN